MLGWIHPNVDSRENVIANEFVVTFIPTEELFKQFMEEHFTNSEVVILKGGFPGVKQLIYQLYLWSSTNFPSRLSIKQDVENFEIIIKK